MLGTVFGRTETLDVHDALIVRGLESAPRCFEWRELSISLNKPGALTRRSSDVFTFDASALSAATAQAVDYYDSRRQGVREEGTQYRRAELDAFTRYSLAVADECEEGEALWYVVGTWNNWKLGPDPMRTEATGARVQAVVTLATGTEEFQIASQRWERRYHLPHRRKIDSGAMGVVCSEGKLQGTAGNLRLFGRKGEQWLVLLDLEKSEAWVSKV